MKEPMLSLALSVSFYKAALRCFLCLSIVFVAVVSGSCSGSSSILHFSTTNRIYQTFSTKNAADCFLKCHFDDNCSSYNYEYRSYQPGEHVCELSRCGTTGTTLVARERFWFHNLRQSKIEDVCKTPEKPLVCNIGPLGMENGAIPNSSITASSTYAYGYAPAKARLNLVQEGAAAWASNRKKVGEWIQVDLGKLTNVTGIATQGSKFENEWVTSYSLKYSVDGTAFTDYESGKNLTGNTDINTVVKNDLLPNIYTRYIRLYPQTWRKHPSLRMELYGVSCI